MASAFAWYSVKIRVIFGVRFDEKLIKKQTYMETETCKLYSGVFWIFLPNFIKIDRSNFELYRFKVVRFFETQCIVVITSILTYRWRREIYGWNMHIAVLQIHQFQLDFHTGHLSMAPAPVSYTHLTLPTNREV